MGKGNNSNKNGLVGQVLKYGNKEDLSPDFYELINYTTESPFTKKDAIRVKEILNKNQTPKKVISLYNDLIEYNRRAVHSFFIDKTGLKEICLGIQRTQIYLDSLAPTVIKTLGDRNKHVYYNKTLTDITDTLMSIRIVEKVEDRDF